jgi:tripartite-type tricarboxylate transporter receptor subunit TctC
MGLMVSSKEPEKTLKDVVAVLRNSPGRWNYGTPGVGSQTHLVTAMFLSAMGLPQDAAVHVPYAGINPAIQELVAGRIQFLFTSVGISLPFIASGAIRPIATTSATRRPQMPDVPTMIELGYPDVKILTWVGLSAPIGTPAPILQRLNETVNQALKDPQVQRQLSALDYSPVAMTRDEYGEMIRREVALYKKAVADGRLVFGK